MSFAAFGAAPGAAVDAPLQDEDNETAEDQEETTPEDEAEADTASVTFENQTSNGSAVVVNETDLPEGGFIAIHLADNVTADAYDDPENVSVGPVLGNSSFLEEGTSENVTVELNQTLDESQPLIAMAHQDTDDNQSYDFPEADEPYTEDDAPVIDVAFVELADNATEEAAEMTEMEETTPEDEMTPEEAEETTPEEDEEET